MFRRSDERSVARSAGSIRSWSVVGLGVGLLAVSGSYFFVDAALDATELVRLSIPVGVSLLVVALGSWLRTSALSARRVGAVFVWSVAGGTVMGLLSGWVTVLQAMEGRPMVRPASIVLTEVALGALGGGLLGVYHGRLRRRTEQLAEERNRLDEFAGIVSHDLRNPLNVAQGHLELARDTGADRHFEAVGGAHDRMERLVEEVLALSRRGRTVADAESVLVGSVAREAWATVETPGMELRVETDREVVADARRLRALFENLFRNSVEHGIEGDSADDDRAGAVVVGECESGFFVADDGPGIPPDERERVFEGGYSTAKNGTGFGLAIVRRIAEAHDWRIRVGESEAGGARFEFVGARDR